METSDTITTTPKFTIEKNNFRNTIYAIIFQNYE